ncbi:MAG TPA: lysophospholipid acyltransferase family protein [Actinomycetota bacterium]|nr:lysophospholipid acyltransferase family protein [Actinomycetota bacterium]
MFYWLLKHIILGPVLRAVYRPTVRGAENVPATGPVILASNHLSFVDSLFIPLPVRRKVVFLGKSDYFDNPKTRWFVQSVGVIPVRREGGSASEAAILAGIGALKAGLVVGIYPEGTRSPDGRLYRGKTGVARMALEGRAVVVPVAVAGTPEIMPLEAKAPRLRGRPVVTFGKPLAFERYFDRPRDRFVLRSVTDEIMYEIMMLSGQEYVDEYASKVKKELAAEREAARAAVTTAGPS